MTGVIDSMKAVRKQTDDISIATDMLMASKAAATGMLRGSVEAAHWS